MALLLIDTPARASRIPPLLRQAFRPFFLLGPAFGLAALWLWVLGFLLPLGFAPVGGGLWWHAHEMLFGFVAAIIAGFLLTAVQNWTNIPGVRGMPLGALVGWWLAARLLLLWPVLPTAAIAGIDLLFLPAVAVVLARPVLAAKQWRNLVFVPILALLALANLATWLALWRSQPEWFARGAYGALFLIVQLIAVLGGRVIPFFTARGTGTPTISPRPAVERLVFASTAAVALAAALDAWHWQGGWPAALSCLAAAAGHGLRQARWRPFSTLREPLLWSLHLAYGFMVPGFLLGAAWSLGLLASPDFMVHAFTVGVISALIIAMIARVSLGHTGRPLQCIPGMRVAFASLTLAGLTRAVLPALGVGNHWLVYGLSALLWALGFGLFLLYYARILCSARADGRMG